MGKKKEENDDPTADFFGDDIDWMDDDDSEEVDEAPAGGGDSEGNKDESSDDPAPTLPVAPPPPPPGAQTVTPLDETEWSQRVSEAPAADSPEAKTSDVPTLQFSAVPTLPPGPELDEDAATVDAQEPASTPVEDEETVVGTQVPPQESEGAGQSDAEEAVEESEAADQAVVEDPPSEAPEGPITEQPLPTEDLPTAVAGEVPPSTEELAKAETEVVAESEEPEDGDQGDEQDADGEEEPQEVFGDDLDGEEDPVPMVHSHDPAPARAVVPSQAPAAVAEGVTPGLTRWEPRGDEAAWKDIATTLVAEASHSDDHRAGLLLAAGTVCQQRLGAHEQAVEHFDAAIAAGMNNVEAHHGRAVSLRALGRAAESSAALALAAEQAGAAEATSELFLEAADAVRDTDPAGALALARRAVQAHPDDYAGWALIRDLLSDGQDDEARCAALVRLSEMQQGWGASSLHLARAQILADKGQTGDAVDAARAAYDAAPDNGSAVVMLADQLSQAKDDEGLAVLYAAQAEVAESADEGWYYLLAARARRRMGDHEAADEAYGKAVEAGFVFAERERQGAALQGENWSALAESLSREAEHSEGPAKAFVLYRLGVLRDKRLQDIPSAIEAFQAALQADPAAAPAADALVRLLEADGQHDALRALWQERLDDAGDPVRAPMHLRMGEICEAAGDFEAAKSEFERARQTEIEGVQSAANDGLARCLARAGDYAALADFWASLASQARDDASKNQLLLQAATTGARLENGAAAAGWLGQILETEPSHSGALFELCMNLEAAGDWAALANALDTASEAEGAENRRAVLKYRAARVRIERGVDTDKVVAGLDAAVQADGAFLPAVWALRFAIAGDAERESGLYRTEAENSTNDEDRSWARFAASQIAEDGGREDLRDILDGQANHPGALAAMEVAALAADDWAALADLWEAALLGDLDTGKARLTVAHAALLHEVGRTDEAVAALGEFAGQAVADEHPVGAAARVAESLGAWDAAATLLGLRNGRSETLHRAGVESGRRNAQGVAADLYRELLDANSADTDAAVGLAQAAQVGEMGQIVRAGAYQTLAGGLPAGPFRCAVARWAALAFENEDRSAEALACWQLDHTGRRDSVTAFRGVERMLTATGDVDGLRALYASQEDPLGLCFALEKADATSAAASTLSESVEDLQPALAARLILEQLLHAEEDWQGVYDQLVARRELMSDTDQMAMLDARRRWLLAEKLAETDMAWDQYKELHDDNPSDREVTEALARIAGVRGESALAVQYLQELAGGAEGAEDAARYQRRIAEVYEANDDEAAARQAFLDALDHQPDDRASLDGLRRLAEKAEDWAAVIQVLQREVGLADANRKAEVLREIATVTEAHQDDRALAVDAWRAVLDHVADDADALTRMMALAKDQAEWATFVEMGTRLSEQKSGAERSSLLREVGIACLEQQDREGAVRYLEQAIGSDPPDIQAATRLEELYRSRNDWGGTIRTLIVQAGLAEGEDKAAKLYAAGEVEVAQRRDKQAAGELFEKVLEVDPNHLPALRFMAEHLFEMGRYAEARPIYEQLAPRVEEGLDLEDFDVRIELSAFHFSFAEMLRTEDESDAALRRYERALELNPTHLASLEAAGPLHASAGEWKQAERVFRQLLQLTGGHGDRAKLANVYTELGMVERELGSQGKAHKRFNKALELHPNHPKALKGMALVLEDQENWGDLLNVFNTIITQVTTHEDIVDAYLTKGRILDERMDRQDKAAQHYQRTIDFDKNQPLAYLRLAELEMRKGEYAQARVFADKGLALKDSGPLTMLRPLLNLAVAAGLKAEGRDDDAEARIGDARSEGGSDLHEALGSDPLADLAALSTVLKEQIPR